MRSRARVAVAVVGVSVVLAACGANPQLAQVGTPTPDPLTATAPTPAPGVIVPTPGPLRVVTRPPAHGATSLPWVLQQLNTDGRSVVLSFPASCVAIAGVQVVESDSDVTLTVWGVSGSGACAASLRYGFGSVALAAPLADRALLHAPVSREWMDAKPFG